VLQLVVVCCCMVCFECVAPIWWWWCWGSVRCVLLGVVEEGMWVCAESAEWVNCEGQEHDLVVQEGLEVLQIVDLLRASELQAQ
jgi:hypothetical protein